MEKLQFLYLLKLIPYFLDKAIWTEREEAIVHYHFEVLQGLLHEGKLNSSRKNLKYGTTGMGIVILEVEPEAETRELMENDPAVKEGVMEATVFPYKVAL